MRFDNRGLLLSSYEHCRKIAVVSPAVHISLDRQSVTRYWFDREFEFLMKRAIEHASG
jgi:hypothetical protein